MTFTEFCNTYRCSELEQRQLACYLACLRMQNAIALGQSQIVEENE